MTLHFTSDSHFCDIRILNLQKRPFASLAAHDDQLEQRWNETVKPGDDVWHLGDFARGEPEKIAALLSRLHGHKHLLIGNNDPAHTAQLPGWVDVQHYTELEVAGHKLVLCHYPFRSWNGDRRGSINLHGHSHGRLSPMARQIDVGVDVWDFRPVTLDQLLAHPRGIPRPSSAADGPPPEPA